MNRRKALIILGILALIVLSFKLFISLQTEYFTEESYFSLRQAKHIEETGIPMFEDTLSYQGRNYKFLPLYHYLIAFLSPSLMKIFTNILIILSSFMIYFIVEFIIKDKTLSLLAAIMSLFIPSSVNISNSSLSPTPLFLLLFLFFIFSYLKRKQWSTWPMISFLVLMLLTSAQAIIVSLGMIVFVLIQKLQNLQPKKQDIELALFGLFLSVWFSVILFKDLLTDWSFLWSNTPAQLIYTSTSATSLFSGIGMLPLLFALIGTNKIFSKHSRNQLFIISLGMVFLLATIFGVLSLNSGLAILGFTASIISGIGIKEIKIFFEQSRFSLKKIFITLLVIFFASTTIIPFMNEGINESIPSKEKVELTKSLNRYEGTIISSPKEAHFVMYYSGLKTYFDDYYAFSNAQERYDNSLRIFRGNSVFQASKILEEENIDFIYLSLEGKKFYNINQLRIANLGSCIDRIRKNEVIVYENNCIIS